MHKEGENWGYMVESRDLEIKRDWGGGLEKGRCPLCGGEENEKHMLLKCKDSEKGRDEWSKSSCQRY
jgi:hypothetical protein